MQLACIAGSLLATLCLTGSAPSARLPLAHEHAAAVTLAERVLARLEEDQHHLSPGALTGIHIEAAGGFVLLQGSVPTRLDRSLIEMLTRSVEGVRAVSNEVQVPGEEPPARMQTSCTPFLQAAAARSDAHALRVVPA